MPQRPDEQLIRLYCDGELNAEQTAGLEAHLKEHAEMREAVSRRVDAERKLREGVGRVMGREDAAPAGLRERVAAAMATAETADVSTAGTGRIESARARRMRWLVGDPHRANVLAVAASLAIVAGAVLFGIFGRTIDDVARPSSDLVSDAMTFADREHRQCAGDLDCLLSRLDETGESQAAALLGQWLDSPVRVFDLEAIGFQFVGAGRCDMPVPARAGHLIYQKIVEPGRRAPMASVYIVRPLGTRCESLCQGLDCGKWRDARDQTGQCKKRVLRATDGRLVYFLVCCDDRDLETLVNHIALPTVAPVSP